jgi:hypothetical protein
MAHWQLGERAKARQVFDRCDESLEGFEKRWKPGIHPEPELLRRIRDEAEALIDPDTSPRPRVE